MASEVDIVNMALTLLGERRIMSLNDGVKPAREANAIFSLTRDALLAGYNWSFSMTRARLPALDETPEFGFANKFQMPSDCLRLVYINDVYYGLDMTDYRTGRTTEFEIDGRTINTDFSAPLNVRYVKRITDANQYSPNFVSSFAMKLAASLAEPLTQSESKWQKAMKMFDVEIALAVKANAIELPPEKFPDDEWLMARR